MYIQKLANEEFDLWFEFSIHRLEDHDVVESGT
jgi:hypothetical protein